MSFELRAELADRVYYGWVIAVACFLASVVVFGTTYAFGVFYDAFIAEFDSSRSVIALVFGLQTAVLYLAAVGAGRLTERVGQRRVAAGSAAVLVVGLVWTSMAGSYAELLVAFGVLSAVGMSGLYIVGYATLPAWFERRRGAAAGLASAGLGVGLVVIPPGADYAISAFGWRGAMLLVAAAVAALSVVVVSLFADGPEAVGADLGVEFADPEAVLAADATDERGYLGSVLRSGSFWLVFAGWLLVFAPLFAVLSHVVLHATDVGVGRSTGVFAIAVVGGTTTLARFGIGWLSDHLGRVRTFVACALLLGGATVGLGLASTTGPFLAFVTALGVGYGGCGGLLGAVTADIFGDRSLNTLFALLSVSFSVSGLLAPSLAGVWFQTAGSYRGAFVVAGLVGALGAAAVWVGVAVRSRGS
ncbi:MFS transporter [Natronomonas sp.]|uniref:MFS transporter n=1 Tax=Natronomonas sp. TaxID=2184060 RepID=UPI00261F8DF1|nr:MFS transporter [Natronomonas sp.]